MGTFWTEEECLRVRGNELKVLKLEYECEVERLSEGPYLPPPDCQLVDYERFPDPCTELEVLKMKMDNVSVLSHTEAGQVAQEAAAAEAAANGTQGGAAAGSSAGSAVLLAS